MGIHYPDRTVRGSVTYRIDAWCRGHWDRPPAESDLKERGTC
jgi:hypothetical protein